MAHDLTEAVAPVCETTVNFLTKVRDSADGRDYEVWYGPTPYGRYVTGWNCECGQETCKHITEASPKRCGWNKHLEPYEMPEGKVCPDCGGPLSFVRVAV